MFLSRQCHAFFFFYLCSLCSFCAIEHKLVALRFAQKMCKTCYLILSLLFLLWAFSALHTSSKSFIYRFVSYICSGREAYFSWGRTIWVQRFRVCEQSLKTPCVTLCTTHQNGVSENVWNLILAA